MLASRHQDSRGMWVWPHITSQHHDQALKQKQNTMDDSSSTREHQKMQLNVALTEYLKKLSQNNSCDMMLIGDNAKVQTPPQAKAASRNYALKTSRWVSMKSPYPSSNTAQESPYSQSRWESGETPTTPKTGLGRPVRRRRGRS